MEGGVFESLCTKWTVRGVGGVGGGGKREGERQQGEQGATEVKLTVTFQFANPAVGLAVQGVADEMVGKMIRAFEGRARELYGRPGSGTTLR
ncbi:hypothetical protein B0T21DRAFT_367984 [Apiosordaria backusii]|uniref:Coenzyme Q-binding protein COQ10 START domain-containing protein n=1 Tax=Apiosordaria backusii TaxID=314023 RepID=A0AA40BJT4_9PEZI|nr:hypothetical protein B0T21DRAFT_367984 [Apiosordaria backusii]